MQIVNGNQYLEEIKDLILDYVKSLNQDLTFQNFDDEIGDLAAKYLPPHGEILAAIDDEGQVFGCVAYHRHSDTRCEVKRLYVKPEYRELKAGRKLLTEIIDHARKAGYQEMVLDTLETLQAAIHLYEKFGFKRIAPYYHNPLEGVVYMGLDL